MQENSSATSPALNMNILLTGGLGFIGSHTAVELLQQGHTVVLYDNLCNTTSTVADRIETITGRSAHVVIGDIRDRTLLEKTLKDFAIDLVIHFAALKAVGESVVKPLEYYDNNITGTLTLLAAMRSAAVSRIIFSSSATVYGEPESLPLTEESALHDATNPYGRTKRMVEEILADICQADPTFCAVNLRYFNPIGAHPSGLIGEDPNGIPNNLLPYVARVAKGALKEVQVFGSDYPTLDGTGVRDFIHVVDLAIGHVKAIDYAMKHTGWIAFNLGCGHGFSVLEVIKAFEQASARHIPYRLVPRRAGDIAESYCSPARAEALLGWKAERGLAEMCRDAWNFELKSGSAVAAQNVLPDETHQS